MNPFVSQLTLSLAQVGIDILVQKQNGQLSQEDFDAKKAAIDAGLGQLQVLYVSSSEKLEDALDAAEQERVGLEPIPNPSPEG